jgi:drug/metabolite transporter (DMT)-like permease
MAAWIAYLICSVVWGSTYFAIALGIGSFTPFGMVASRYLLAGLLALGLGRLLREAPVLRRDLPHLALQGILLLGISNALVTWAESRVPSGLTAILCSMTPLFYGLLGREALSLRGWAGLLIGLGGVAVLARPAAGAHLDLFGAAGLVLATFLWAYGTLHGRRHVKGRGLMGQVGVQMIAGGLFGTLMATLTGGFLHQPLTLRAASAVGYLLVFGSLVAYTAFGYLSRVWSPARMSTYTYLNPLVALLLGSLFLREPFSLRVVAGMLLILASVALVQLAPAAKGHEAEALPEP